MTHPLGSDNGTCPGHEGQTLVGTYLGSVRTLEPHNLPGGGWDGQD